MESSDKAFAILCVCLALCFIAGAGSCAYIVAGRPICEGSK